MTADYKGLLEDNLDGTVEMTLTNGEVYLIRPVILVDEPPTPDLFYLELNPDGSAIGTAGRSVLLDEIASVRLP
jgi:hypothetical protein